MSKVFQPGTSKVAKSKYFEPIMKKYELIGRQTSIAKFHKDYVEPIDPEISYRQWKYFIEKFRKHAEKKHRAMQERILKKTEETIMTEVKLEESSIKKILTLADLTLDEILEDPEKLEKIPAEQRMTWLFNAMKARDSRATVQIKKKEEDRKSNMYEDMMKGAQYGAIEVDAIDDEDEDIKQLTVPAAGVDIAVTKSIDTAPAEEVER